MPKRSPKGHYISVRELRPERQSRTNFLAKAFNPPGSCRALRTTATIIVARWTNWTPLDLGLTGFVWLYSHWGTAPAHPALFVPAVQAQTTKAMATKQLVAAKQLETYLDQFSWKMLVNSLYHSTVVSCFASGYSCLSKMVIEGASSKLHAPQ